MISINYQDSRPIYEQIVSGYQKLIFRGVLRPDERIPSVRSMAATLTANPNTVQKAYAELERQGIIAALPGRGSIILSGSGAVADAGRETLREELLSLVNRAKTLGMPEEDFMILTGDCWRMEPHSSGKETET